MGTGLTIVVIAVVLALGFGLYRARTDGRFKSAPTPGPQVVEQAGDGSAGVVEQREDGASPVVEQRGAPATSGRRDHTRDHHPTAPPTGAAWAAVLEALPEAQLGERATLLQFSSAFCAPCRATRSILSDVADVVPGVVHLEVDAEHHLELVRALDVLRTPTTLILDASGSEATRAAGAPRKEAVLSALDGIVEA